VIRVFSTKKAIGLAALVVGLSAAIIAPALAVQSSLILPGSNSYVSEETSSKAVDESPASPAGTVSPPSIDSSSPPSDVDKPSTAPLDRPAVGSSPTPVVTLSPTPQETSAPAPTPVQAPIVQQPTQAPIVQQPTAAPVVGTVSVSQVTPENGLGEAVLQWSSIPGATEYRIFKTGTIRPSWRLFYIYPSSITSITIFDQPGSIAIYKIMAVINSQETLLGEVTYRPTN
jgi:hypothetical protein